MGEIRVYGSARTERVTLAWWQDTLEDHSDPFYKSSRRKLSGNTRGVVRWGQTPPVIHLIDFDCLGVTARHDRLFNIQGILPANKLPKMTEPQKKAMLEVLRVRLEDQTGLQLNPIRLTLVDWECQGAK